MTARPCRPVSAVVDDLCFISFLSSSLTNALSNCGVTQTVEIKREAVLFWTSFELYSSATQRLASHCNFNGLKTLTLIVHVGHIGVSVLHQALTWTEGYVTCVCAISARVYLHGLPRLLVTFKGPIGLRASTGFKFVHTRNGNNKARKKNKLTKQASGNNNNNKLTKKRRLSQNECRHLTSSLATAKLTSVRNASYQINYRNLIYMSRQIYFLRISSSSP